MSTPDHPALARVAAALAAAGLRGSADGVRMLPTAVRTAAQAAEALGVDVAAIANSLVFRMSTPDGDAPLLALTSGAHRADTRALAEHTGAAHVDMADPDFVRAHTGQVIGGVAPVGHPAPITTLVDATLARHDTVWAAAGHPASLFPITFADLVTLTGGRAVDVAAPRREGTGFR
ncbi:YbaK/EbsC family protein [Saccharomonospora saliphila]|uniref:YbaK/EbsC family protein n=1 Tax=Saccharomonospora saliphila TaxID=369829 RepID=UPI0003664006|nr:YbaK/EbsC family protein [Saccharomonospora saliphila]